MTSEPREEALSLTSRSVTGGARPRLFRRGARVRPANAARARACCCDDAHHHGAGRDRRPAAHARDLFHPGLGRDPALGISRRLGNGIHLRARGRVLLFRSDLQLLRGQPGRACRTPDLRRRRNRHRLSGDRAARGPTPARSREFGRRTASTCSAIRCRSTQVGNVVRRNGAGAREGLHRAGGLGRLLRRLHPGSPRVEVAPAGAADHRDTCGDGFVPGASPDPAPAAARANKSFTPSVAKINARPCGGRSQ